MTDPERIEKEAEEVANALKADMVMVGGKPYYSKDAVLNAMDIKSRYDMEWFNAVLRK